MPLTCAIATPSTARGISESSAFSARTAARSLPSMMSNRRTMRPISERSSGSRCASRREYRRASAPRDRCEAPVVTLGTVRVRAELSPRRHSFSPVKRTADETAGFSSGTARVVCDTKDLMNIFRTKSSQVPGPAEALPGRDEAIPVPDRHVVLGTPLLPPFPEGVEYILLGHGVLLGGRAPLLAAPRRVHHGGGLRRRQHSERDVPRGLQRAHGPRRGRPRSVPPGRAAARRAPAHVLGGARPHAGHAPGQRRRHAVPVGDLLHDARAGRDRPRVARRATRRLSPRTTAGRSRPRSPRPARSTRPRSTTSSTCRRTRTGTAGSPARASPARSASA